MVKILNPDGLKNLGGKLQFGCLLLNAEAFMAMKHKLQLKYWLKIDLMRALIYAPISLIAAYLKISTDVWFAECGNRADSQYTTQYVSGLNVIILIKRNEL